MKKSIPYLVAALSLFVGAQQAMAQGPSLVESANLICEQPGGSFAFDTVKGRVWQTERGEKEGLELNVTEFRRLRCPNCYDIQASLEIFGSTLDYQFTVRGTPGKLRSANLSVSIESQGNSRNLAEIRCRVVRR